MRKRLTVRGVHEDAIEALREMREIEQRLVGAIVSEAIWMYWDAHHGDDQEIDA